MSYLRFSKRLVVTAAVASLAGYMALVGVADATWFDADHVTPVSRQLLTISSIVLAGVVGWLICDMVKHWFERQEELRQSRLKLTPESSGGEGAA